MGQVVNTVILEKGLKAEFNKAYANGEDPNEIMPMIMQTQSSANQEKYGWLGAIPQLVEWKDERILKGLLDFDYTIVNKPYEATLQVDRYELEDDQIGAVKVRIADLARKAKIHVRKLFFDAVIAGTSDLCYDGQAFFSNSHSEGASGTQDNLLTGNGATVANLKTDLTAAIAAMKGFKDDQGEPYNEGELNLYVVAPVEMEATFRELLNSQLISNTTNIFKGIAKLVTSSRLSDDDSNDWYLFDASGSVKPFIKQNRQNPEFKALEGNSDRGFMSRRYLYGIDYRVGFSYGLWQKAIKVVNT